MSNLADILHRGLAIHDALDHETPQTAAEIAEALVIPVSTVKRMLAALEERGRAHHESRGWLLPPSDRLFDLGLQLCLGCGARLKVIDGWLAGRCTNCHGGER